MWQLQKEKEKEEGEAVAVVQGKVSCLLVRWLFHFILFFHSQHYKSQGIL